MHQRDLLRPTGGGGIDGDSDGRAEGSDRAQRRLLRAVQRSGKPFLADAEGGRQGGLPSPHAGGAGVARVGSADDPGLLAGSAWAQRAQLLDLAGRLPQELRLRQLGTLEAANRFLLEEYIAEFNRRFQVAPKQRGNAFVPCRSRDLERIFSLQFERSVNRDNTVSFQNLSLQIERVRWRATLAGCQVTVHQHLDATLSLTHGPHCLGRYDASGAPFPAKASTEMSRGRGGVHP